MSQIRKNRRRDKELTMRRFEKQRRQNYLATPGPFPYIVILDNLKKSFNIGKIFRSCEAFGAQEIHVIGIDYFDPGPAKGALKWVPTIFHDAFSSCYASLIERGYTLFTLEPEVDETLQHSVLPEKSGFVFGHEEFGLSFAKEDFPGIIPLKINQYGRVQSLNVSIAASVVMYEYIRQHPPQSA